MSRYILPIEQKMRSYPEEQTLESQEYIISQKREIRFKHIVYFLISGEEIVYVGKSDVGISRVYSHLQRGKFIFDTYWYKECTEKELKRLEKRYIKQFQPKYNVQHKMITTIKEKTVGGKKITFKHKRQPKKPWKKYSIRSIMKKEAKAWAKG